MMERGGKGGEKETERMWLDNTDEELAPNGPSAGCLLSVRLLREMAEEGDKREMNAEGERERKHREILERVRGKDKRGGEKERGQKDRNKKRGKD